MSDELDISVVISTYNRCDLLPVALESVLNQETCGVHYEVIVIDNNSTDRTREVVESFITRGHANLRYVFEGRQGLSYGRNAGIAEARAPIIAFTDDDVHAAQNWIRSIKGAFDTHPEVDAIGGKVLPRWSSEPPVWLDRAHWAPLALVDYGDMPFLINAGKPICLVGANMSFRREVFDRIGMFMPDFQRVKNGIGSTEDHEMHLRLWRAGGQELYAPEIVVTADVQAERMTKAYHRRWHAGHGGFCALMDLIEVMNTDGTVDEQRAGDLKLFSVPAHVYRELLSVSGRWLCAAARGNESALLEYENAARYLLSYIDKRYEQHAAECKRSLLLELGAFAKALVQKKAGGGEPAKVSARFIPPSGR